jgi:ATP-dependent Clp protease ATP-binding subunit ClpA
VVQRGELSLTKPARPRGSFLLLGPTGVGKTETVVVLTNQLFGAEKLFRFDMSEFQTQESLGLLLGARLGEAGYLGAVRERASEGSLLFDEAEKAHPRVLDILLQLLDAARITVATGQTLDFSGFYVWLTSNIGSAELMTLQHSNDATLERHVLSRAQQALRPEIFARITEKLVFNRLSYEHQLEIAEKFLSRETDFLAARGHKLELDKAVLPFLVRKGFHPKLGARPMRDAVEKQIGDALAAHLIAGNNSGGRLQVDESRDCLIVR